jgi:uncharacterized protein
MLRRRDWLGMMAAMAVPGNLGKTGLAATRIGLACERAQTSEVIRRAADLGMRYFHSVGPRPGASEVDYEKIRDGLKGLRQGVTLSTGTSALSASAMRADLESQLRRLGTDYLDVWLLQAVDEVGHLTEERVDFARQAKAAGKVRAIGLSTHQPELLHQPMLRFGIEVAMVFCGVWRTPEQLAPVKELHRAGLGILAMRAMNFGNLGEVSAGDALSWLRDCPYLDAAPVGVDTDAQLVMNAA